MTKSLEYHAFGTISVDPTINTTAAIIDHPYLEVHRISNERGTMYAQRFKEHVLKYAAEWEATITIRVTAGLKELDEQRLDLEQYTTCLPINLGLVGKLFQSRLRTS
jgi:hypothetical protein